MNLQHLPYDIVEVIAQYLSVKDMLACSATCSSLRDVFNSDVIWKRKCTAEGFVNINNSDWLFKLNMNLLEVTSLSPLSTWRKCYMMQNRLYRNWREGAYGEVELSISAVKDPENTDVRFYKDDYIFIFIRNITFGLVTTGQYYSEYRMEVWNIEEPHDPHGFFYFDVKDFFETNQCLNFELLEVVDDMIIIICQSKLALIYKISLSSFPPRFFVKLAHAFIIDLSEDQSNSLITRARTEPDYYISFSNQCYCNETTLFVRPNLLISNSQNNQTLHVWNIQSGKKVAEDTFSTYGNVRSMDRICLDENNKTVVVRLTLQKEEYRYHDKGYNLSKMEFDSFSLKHKSFDMNLLQSNNNLVIAAEGNQLFSYDYKTSRSLAGRKFNRKIMVPSVIFAGTKLICGTWDNTMFVMNSNLDVLSSHKLNAPFFGLSPIHNRFVMVSGSNEVSGLWEIGKTPVHLLDFSYNSFGDKTQHCTKLALKGQYTIFIYCTTFGKG